jgi:hypothetical protein
MQNALNNGKEHDMLEWLGNMLCVIIRPIFVKTKTCWLLHLSILNSIVVLQAKQLSFHNDEMFYPISIVQCL